MGRDKRKAEEECEEDEEAFTAATGTGISLQEEQEEECSYECDEEMRAEMRKAGKDVNKYCEERTWYVVYRIIPRRPDGPFLDYDRIAYVGITKDYNRRQCEHQGNGKRFPRGAFQFECLVEVPHLGVALSIEQALMDMYGYLNTKKNINLDHPEKGPQVLGIHSHAVPTLRNTNNAFYPGRKGWRLYCAARVNGQVFLALNAGPPVIKGNNNHLWEANFPHRDCSHWWDLRRQQSGSAS
jgi:predicted GIY-YIG superfamily endonuclease